MRYYVKPPYSANLTPEEIEAEVLKKVPNPRPFVQTVLRDLRRGQTRISELTLQILYVLNRLEHKMYYISRRDIRDYLLVYFDRREAFKYSSKVLQKPLVYSLISNDDGVYSITPRGIDVLNTANILHRKDIFNVYFIIHNLTDESHFYVPIVEIDMKWLLHFATYIW